MYERAHKYANVDVNNWSLYVHTYDYVGAGVNNISFYGHTTIRKLVSAGVNNWCTHDYACAMSSYLCGTPN